MTNGLKAVKMDKTTTIKNQQQPKTIESTRYFHKSNYFITSKFNINTTLLHY